MFFFLKSINRDDIPEFYIPHKDTMELLWYYNMAGAEAHSTFINILCKIGKQAKIR